MIRWTPDTATRRQANLSAAMARTGHHDYESFFRWSVEHRDAFWSEVVDRLGIVFRKEPTAIATGLDDPEHTTWLPGAELNIVESCFRGTPDAPAVVAWHDGQLVRMTRSELELLVGRVAHGLAQQGIGQGSKVAIAMPMTIEAVAAYLATVWVGGVVVSIADSFAPDEIATRLRIAGADLTVTQDVLYRSGKTLPMYEKLTAATDAPAIVVDTGAGLSLRPGDVLFSALIEGPRAAVVPGPPGRHTNILFSSGTTGDPKAVPWTQLTPLKAAMDGHFHQDIHPEDVVAWPTNLGWMMGPWLIYASLINGAALALYGDAPTGRGFAEFVRDAGVSILGVVPSLVAAWRAHGVLEGLDWSQVRLFSSTGEASDPDDMGWLMRAAGGKPVIEYCGGTEIGGGYITGTVLEESLPGTFTTPALGLDIRILDEAGSPARSGEVYLVPPSIGLSEELLNRDHHAEYFEGVPASETPLRRHGDQMELLADGRFRALGRVDDTMNLGGIKVSSAEIERVVSTVPGTIECAAVATSPPGGGPSRLVIYAVVERSDDVTSDTVMAGMQSAIRTELNPLFKVHEVVLVEHLPRTASAKVMRRSLRETYTEQM